MTVATFKQPNFTDPAQSASVYKAAIDAAISVLATIGADYACHAKATPDMQVLVDPGQLFLANSTLVSNAQQTSITIVAPVGNPRIDRIVINDQTGVVSVITGTPAASPAAPAITAGTRPIAQILLQTSSIVIANSMITDERVITTFDVSTYMRTLLGAVDSAAARATLVAAGLAVANVFTDEQTISNVSPRITWIETDAAADNKRWDVIVGNERLAIRVLNDAANIGIEIIGIERTGTAVDSVTLGGTTVAVTNALTVGLDSTINGVKAGRGGSAIATNTAFGASALNANTTGSNNTAAGYFALGGNTTGTRNTATGHQALNTNTTGNYNTATGAYALNVSIGFNNTATGYQALVGNTTGGVNTAFGASALSVNTTGNYNTAAGYQALNSNTTGSGNTAMSPLNSAGTYAPVFNPTVENDRLCMGSTGVTNAYVQVAWTVVSDARDKTNIGDVPHGLDFVSKLKPVSYKFKMSREDETPKGPLRYGFLAQDILPLEGPGSVIIDSEDPEKLRYNESSMVAVLVKAIQELKAEFDSYKASHP